ncbi:MAG: HAMP domain-containing histidine kinase [Chlamydiae bacterium]|nr:HAMP domain-containing histidine kinase [Chlamydiota bacterium]
MKIIINDILEVQRLESEMFEMDFKKINVEMLLKEAIEANMSLALNREVELVLENCPSDLEILADYKRMMQVMTNLISNGLKFSPREGKIFFRADKIDKIIRISIQDQGPGIEEGIKTTIFEKFVKGEPLGQTMIPGTGLGLYICKNIIEKLGGTINFTTKKGQGTTFYFDLPMAT